MSLNLPICHACNTTLSRKQRTTITKNVTNPPYLGAQLKKCDQQHILGVLSQYLKQYETLKYIVWLARCKILSNIAGMENFTQGRLFFYNSPQMLGNIFSTLGKNCRFWKKKEKKIQRK